MVLDNDIRKNCSLVLENEVEECIITAKHMIEVCIQCGAQGVSAPQMGIYKRFFVWQNSDDSYQIIFNPSYKDCGKITSTVETCLSCLGQYYYLKRSNEIDAVFYTYYDKKLIKHERKYIGNYAIRFAHECDHVNYNEGVRVIQDFGELIMEDEREKAGMQ